MKTAVSAIAAKSGPIIPLGGQAHITMVLRTKGPLAESASGKPGLAQKPEPKAKPKPTPLETRAPKTGGWANPPGSFWGTRRAEGKATYSVKSDSKPAEEAPGLFRTRGLKLPSDRIADFVMDTVALKSVVSQANEKPKPPVSVKRG